MYRVAGEQDASVREALRNQRRSGGPRLVPNEFDGSFCANAAEQGVAYHGLIGRRLGVLRLSPEHEFIFAVEREQCAAQFRIHDPIHPGAAAPEIIAVERRRAQIARNHAATEVGLLEPVVAGIADTERAAHGTMATVAADQVVCPPLFALAVSDAPGRQRNTGGIMAELIRFPSESQFNVGARAYVLEQKILNIHLVR